LGAVRNTAADRSAPGAALIPGHGHHRPGRQPMLATPAKVIVDAVATPGSPGNGGGRAAIASGHRGAEFRN